MDLTEQLLNQLYSKPPSEWTEEEKKMLMYYVSKDLTLEQMEEIIKEKRKKS